MQEDKKQQAQGNHLPENKIQQPPHQDIPAEPIKQPENIKILREELLSMQFEPKLIQRALEQTSDLEKAIEYIVSVLEEEDVKQVSSADEVKLILLVRMDLRMGLGKVAAQCAHATLRAYQLARNRAQNDEQYSLTFIQWLESGQEKVAYQVNDQQQLFDTLKQFQTLGIGTCYIRDAGRTQIAAGSATVGGVGPWSGKKLEAVTRALRRL